jgi:hypothetical protein
MLINIEKGRGARLGGILIGAIDFAPVGNKLVRGRSETAAISA